ncbi:helix-turn-helix transcriptional regulator, partial [Streptomyces europaeiscabiei]|uniref:helix-turn-helix transcriptional regulator n=2 Tax=Streptomyces europaeiscabiei TaxID=146819 RepID=UPI0006283760
MRNEQYGNSDNPALTELRERLNGGLDRSRMDRKDLVARSGLGRTTVWEALQAGEPVPSVKTVAALARALKLPVEELRALQRDAAGGGGEKRLAPGRPIAEYDPHSLEVHPAGPSTLAPGNDAPQAGELPGYVERAHDRVLAQAVQDAAAGRSRMVVLVGSSSTGKTRACWEAVQPLVGKGWRLWHPFEPTHAEAALDNLHRVAPRSVVWLNEAQHYLEDREAGKRIAAALYSLLTSPERSPVLVLGTLWPEHARRYTALPSPGEEDPYSRVRELLSGRTLTVPDTFDTQALATAAALARDGDRLLADALTRAGTHGRVAQDLAGAPELLNRYKQATPAARALLEAAMDARRLGVGLHLLQAFLTDAAADYLHDTDWNQLTNDWAEKAYAELAEPVHGKQAPLHSTTPR